MGSKMETLPGSTSSTNSPVMECSRPLVNGCSLRKTSLSSPKVHLGKWASCSSPASDVNIGSYSKLAVSHPTFKTVLLPSYKQLPLPLQPRMTVNPLNSDKTLNGGALGTLWVGLLPSFPILTLLVHDYIRDSPKQSQSSLPIGYFLQQVLSDCSTTSMNYRLQLKPSPTTVMHSLFLSRGYPLPVEGDYLSELGNAVTACSAAEGCLAVTDSLFPKVVESSVDTERTEQTLASQNMHESCEEQPQLLRDNIPNSGCLAADDNPSEYQREYENQEVESNSDCGGTIMVNTPPGVKFSDTKSGTNFGFTNDKSSDIREAIDDDQDENSDSDEGDNSFISIANVNPVAMISPGVGDGSGAWHCNGEGAAGVMCDWWKKCEERARCTDEEEEEEVEWDEDTDESGEYSHRIWVNVKYLIFLYWKPRPHL